MTSSFLHCLAEMCRSRRDQEAKESPRCSSSEPSAAARYFSRGRWRSSCSDCMLQYVVRGLRSGSYLRTYMQSYMLGASPQALRPLSCMFPERLSATALACSSYVVAYGPKSTKNVHSRLYAHELASSAPLFHLARAPTKMQAILAWAASL